MVELTEYMTHPGKPGVRAKMHTQESIDRHAADGWILEEKEKPITPADIVAKWSKRFGKKPHHKKKVSTMLRELEG